MIQSPRRASHRSASVPGMLGARLATVAAVLLALAAAPLLLVAGIALIYLIWPFYSVAVVTYRLSLVPDELQGRINSSFRVLTYGVEPLGAALGGVLIGVLGPRPVLWLIAGGIALTTLFAGCSRVRKI